MSALLPGVRPHGRRFQVRIRPFPAETFVSAPEANMRAIELHALRHTAVSLMREAGLAHEYVAQRIGHADGGALLLKRYRHTHRAEVRRALDELGNGMRATLTATDTAEVVGIGRRSA